MIKREVAKEFVGDGWHRLIDKVYDRLEKKHTRGYITDVKQKYGGLRIYAYEVDNDFLDFLDEIEEISFTVCEYCGSKGELRPELGWILTLCDEHLKEVFERRKGNVI